MSDHGSERPGAGRPEEPISGHASSAPEGQPQAGPGPARAEWPTRRQAAAAAAAGARGAADPTTPMPAMFSAPAVPTSPPSPGPDMFASASVLSLLPTDGIDGTDSGPADGRGTEEDEEERAARRRWLPWVIGGGVVVVAVVVGVVVLVLGKDDAAPPGAPETVTVTAAAPTPTTSPVARGEGTELFTALPGTVRQLVLTEITPLDLVGDLAAATEAYTLVYSGTAEDGAILSVTMTVSQWPTPEQASAAAAPLIAGAGEPTSEGEVEVAGAVTGSFALFGEPAAEKPAGTVPPSPADTLTPSTEPATSEGAAVWTNGTLVLDAVGPGAEIANFYRAFAF